MAVTFFFVLTSVYGRGLSLVHCGSHVSDFFMSGPLWINPSIKSEISVRKLNSMLKKKKKKEKKIEAQVEDELTILPP